MKHFVDIDEQHFVIFEAETESEDCPTCGTPWGHIVARHVVLCRGDRAAKNAAWVVLRHERVDRLPAGFEECQKAAKKFARGVLS